jgi:hypothetical protein
VADRLVVNLRQFHQFHHIDASLAALALGHKVRRPAHHFGNLMLRQARLLARGDETLQERIVGFLEPGGPCFS